MTLPDIDIDVFDRTALVKLFPQAVRASLMHQQEARLTKHDTGIYLQRIPVDPETRLAVFPSDMAEEKGFMKIDILPNRAYSEIQSPEELEEILALPTDWSWYMDERFYGRDNPDALIHLGSHFKTVRKHPPGSILDLAILIALIRPGKKHLIGKSRPEILSEIWLPGEDGFTFKKSHSCAYAMLISVHAKLLAIQYGMV